MRTQQQIIDDLNYDSDRRNCKPAPTKVTVTLEGDEDTVEVQLPTKWEVCDLCNGKGTHVNPSIDCGGLTSEDFDQDPDFAEMYMDGVYDQTCNRCEGRTTIAVPDFELMSEVEREAYKAHEAQEDELAQEEAWERRMGC